MWRISFFFEKKNVFFSVLSGYLSIIIINFVIYEGIVYINKIIAEITQAQDWRVGNSGFDLPEFGKRNIGLVFVTPQ